MKRPVVRVALAVENLVKRPGVDADLEGQRRVAAVFLEPDSVDRLNECLKCHRYMTDLSVTVSRHDSHVNSESHGSHVGLASNVVPVGKQERPWNELDVLVSTRAEVYNGRWQDLAALIGMTYESLLRAMKAGTFDYENCLKLAAVLGLAPAAVFRAARKAEFAELLERIAGPIVPLSALDRAILEAWQAAPPPQREIVRLVLNVSLAKKKKGRRAAKHHSSFHPSASVGDRSRKNPRLS